MECRTVIAKHKVLIPATNIVNNTGEAARFVTTPQESSQSLWPIPRADDTSQSCRHYPMKRTFTLNNILVSAELVFDESQEAAGLLVTKADESTLKIYVAEVGYYLIKVNAQLPDPCPSLAGLELSPKKPASNNSPGPATRGYVTRGYARGAPTNRAHNEPGGRGRGGAEGANLNTSIETDSDLSTDFQETQDF